MWCIFGAVGGWYIYVVYAVNEGRVLIFFARPLDDRDELKCWPTKTATIASGFTSWRRTMRPFSFN